MKTLSGCSLALLVIAISMTAMADPTRPAPGWQSKDDNSKAQPAIDIRLQLIKQTDSGPVALLNGQLVRKGEFYQQYQVLEIQNKQVVLQLNGERQVVRLLNTAIKQYED